LQPPKSGDQHEPVTPRLRNPAADCNGRFDAQLRHGGFMNPEIKAKWVAALRSGEYKQGRGRLNRVDKFCCLGVLCDLHAKESGGKWEQHTIDEYVHLYMGSSCQLHPAVLLWAGLNYVGGGEVRIAGNQDFLFRHNDSGRTFAEIADAIESQL
jgi:hypothetical protein